MGLKSFSLLTPFQNLHRFPGKDFIFFFYAGFRPGGRGPFVSAKGPKTMFALAWP